MKKLLLVLTLGLMAAFSANAQLYLGGSLGFDSAGTWDDEGNPKASFSIAPEIGYIINDKLAVGGVIGIGNTGGGVSVDINPYVRYFMLEMGPVSLFLDGEVAFGVYGGQFGFGGVGVAPGIAIPVNDHLSFVGHFARIGYYGSFIVDVNPANIRMGLYYAF